MRSRQAGSAANAAAAPSIGSTPPPQVDLTGRQLILAVNHLRARAGHDMLSHGLVFSSLAEEIQIKCLIWLIVGWSKRRPSRTALTGAAKGAAPATVTTIHVLAAGNSATSSNSGSLTSSSLKTTRIAARREPSPDEVGETHAGDFGRINKSTVVELISQALCFRNRGHMPTSLNQEHYMQSEFNQSLPR